MCVVLPKKMQHEKETKMKRSGRKDCPQVSGAEGKPGADGL